MGLLLKVCSLPVAFGSALVLLGKPSGNLTSLCILNISEPGDCAGHMGVLVLMQCVFDEFGRREVVHGSPPVCSLSGWMSTTAALTIEGDVAAHLTAEVEGNG